MAALLAMPPATKRGKRDQLILVLLYDSAIRVSELLNLDVRSINLNAEIPYLRVLGKGEKERIVSITDKTVDHIRAYLKLYHPENDPDQPLIYTEIKGCKEGLCTKEKNAVQELWQQANSNFNDIADLGMKNADGSFVGFWGAMSDETMSFMPWTDDFSRGLYLTGIEVYEDTPVPDGWVKWVMPARKYLVTEVAPESYGGTFRNVIDSLIPELGLKLAGAVCDFTEPTTGQNKLFFPVE